MKGLIFITGLRKSGTSMTKALLDGHSNVFMFPANELELFHYSAHNSVLADKYTREHDVQEIKALLTQNDFITRLNRHTAGCDDYRTSIDVAGFQRDLHASKVSNCAELVEATFRAMAQNCSFFSGDFDQIRCAAKCVLNSEYVPELLQWFPDAKIIYVLRNPYGHFDSIRTVSRKNRKSQRSTAHEGMRRSVLSNTYPILGVEMRRMTMSYYFMRKWRDLYPDNFYISVYDRVLQDPETEMRQLSEFLGIPFQQCLLEPTIAGLPTSGNSSKGKQFNGIDSSPATHWKETISPWEVRLINEYFGDIIGEFGFERLESESSVWRLAQIYERPKAYLANRLLFKAKAWFSEIPHATPEVLRHRESQNAVGKSASRTPAESRAA